jgi:uncharacterized iron-regulated protein
MRRILLAGLCLCSLSACGHAPQKEETPTPALTGHVLVDKIWDVKAERFIDKAQLVEKIVQSDYLLLGETHDNPLHHRYQAELLDVLAAKRRSAVVAFEMIDEKQGQLLADKPVDSVDALIATLNQVKATWNYERNYRGVFDSAMKAGYGIYPASLGREAIMEAARHGDTSLPDTTKTLLSAVTLSAEQEAQSRKEIESSHCGMLPETMVSPMMFTQRVKDAVMAERLAAHRNVDVRVLVAGSGHARTDRGVPLYLAKDTGIVAIAWAEVVPERTAAPAYGEHWGSERLPFDYVWFTPRVERPDPCAGMRQHMQKRQGAKPAENETGM